MHIFFKKVHFCEKIKRHLIYDHDPYYKKEIHRCVKQTAVLPG